jgi:hypothetical protein
MKRLVAAGALVWTAVGTVVGQTPQPFPRAGLPSQELPGRVGTPTQAPPSTPAPALADIDAPTAAAVGFPIYPTATFLASYDAGKGQRYYLFGTMAPFEDLVTYYRTVLRDRGTRVYEEPGTHMFSQRFREETMAFPPGVTVKDWTSGGSLGYPNPTPGAEPERFPTVIMIVPPPPEAAEPRR